MVFLEWSVDVWDPLNRNTQFEKVPELKWQIEQKQPEPQFDNNPNLEVKTRMVAHFRDAVLFLQGPNGVLVRLNDAGCLNAKTGQPFEIWSQQEYDQFMQKTHCIVL